MTKEHIEQRYYKYLDAYGLSAIDKSNIFVFSLSENEYLFNEGEGIDYLYILISGKIKCFSTSSTGKTLLYEFFTPTQLLGEVEIMLDNKISSLNALAISDDVKCIGISLSVYKDKLLNNIEFLRKLSIELSGKLKTRDNNSKIIILYSLEARLCSYILDNQINGSFRVKLTELSEFFGVSYRHLLRTIHKLIADNLITKANNEYTIINYQEIKIKSENINY